MKPGKTGWAFSTQLFASCHDPRQTVIHVTQMTQYWTLVILKPGMNVLTSLSIHSEWL